MSSKVKIELLASYSAGCSGFDSCDMHGGAGDTTTPAEDPWFCVRPAPGKCTDFDDGSYIVAIQARLPLPAPPPPPPPPEVRRLLISGSRRMDQAGLEYARTLVRHARSRGWEIIVGDNPQGVDAEVIRTAIEEGYDDHLVIYGAYRRCRIKDTGRAKVRLVDGGYYGRDRFMAGQCDAAVGVWNGNSPGTQKAITSTAEMGKHAFLMGRGTEGWSNQLPGDEDIFSME